MLGQKSLGSYRSSKYLRGKAVKEKDHERIDYSYYRSHPTSSRRISIVAA